MDESVEEDMSMKSNAAKGTTPNSFVLWITPIVFVVLAYFMVPSGGFVVMGKYSEAQFKSYVLERHGTYENAMLGFNTAEVLYQDYQYTPDAFLNRYRQDDLLHTATDRLYYAGLLSIVMIFSLIVLPLFFKKKAQRETVIRGLDCVDGKTLKKLLRTKKQVSKFKIAGIPMVKGSEIQHTLLMGSTGVGKTSAMASLVHKARRKGISMVIYDFNHYYTKTLYREGDILLNPFDVRMRYWDIWQETQHRPDFDLIAAAQIPISPAAEVEQWNQFARTLYATIAHSMGGAEQCNTDTLLMRLLKSGPAALLPFVKGTEAETLTHPEFAKFAMSVKAVLSTHLKSMQYLPDKGKPFCIREWVENKKKKGQCVFITTRPRYHESLRPLLTLWLDLFLGAAMDLPENINHRLFFLMDEFPTLYKLPSIERALSTVRKNGVGIFLGAQSYAQIYEHYGEYAAQSIIDNCNTSLYFRCNNQLAAAYSAKQLGDVEVQKVIESLTKTQQGDTQTTTQTTTETKPTVLMSEILRQPDLSAFIRLKGDYPIASVSFKHAKHKQIAEPFIARSLPKKAHLENAMMNTPQSRSN